MKAFLPLLLVMAVGVFALVLAGCSIVLPARVQKEVIDTAGPLTAHAAIPAIDARAPVDTETATFALG